MRAFCSAACRLRATVEVSAATARKLGLDRRAKRPVTIGTATSALTVVGSRSMRIQLTSRAERALRRARGPVKGEVRVRATGTGTAETKVKVTLKR